MPPEPSEDVHSIAVLRALQFGDLLCTVPALRAIRAAHPQAHIALIGLPWAASLVDRYAEYLDEHIPFPGYPGLPEQPVRVEAVTAFIAHMQARSFDLLIQMQGDGSIVNPLVTLLGARRTAGFYQPGAWRPDAETFIPYPSGGHEVERMLALPRHLGMQGDREPYFPVLPDEGDEAASLLEAVGAGDRIVCIHPGARDATRRWSPVRFAAVGDRLAERGWTVVLTGTESEREITTAVARTMRNPGINLAGRTSTGVLAAVLQRAGLLVCNDTGVSHLAAATRTPSVVVFSGSDPERWAPLNRSLHRAVHGNAIGATRCAPATVQQVLAPAHELLLTAAAHAA